MEMCMIPLYFMNKRQLQALSTMVLFGEGCLGSKSLYNMFETCKSWFVLPVIH